MNISIIALGMRYRVIEAPVAPVLLQTATNWTDSRTFLA